MPLLYCRQAFGKDALARKLLLRLRLRGVRLG